MSQLYLYIFKSLFGLLQRTLGIYLAEHWHWNSSEAYIVLCWWPVTTAMRKWFGGDCPCVLISLCASRTATNTRDTHVGRTKQLSTDLKLNLQRLSCHCPGKGYCESLFRSEGFCTLNVRESLFQLYPCNYIYELCWCACLGLWGC